MGLSSVFAGALDGTVSVLLEQVTDSASPSALLERGALQEQPVQRIRQGFASVQS